MTRHLSTCFLVSLAVLLVAACGNGRRAQVATVFPNFLAADQIVNTNGPGISESDDCRICCDGLDVYVAYNDDRDDPDGNDAVYFNVSRDGGWTWLASDVRISRGDGDSGQAEICCAGDRVYVVWNDDRNDPGDNDSVFFNVSFDRGATWLAQDIQVDDGAGDCDNITICCDGDRVHVAWEDDRNGGNLHDIFSNSSTDGGLTWQPADRRLNSNPPGLTRARDVHLCCEGDNVFAVWSDARDGEEDIYLNYSRDAGATWLATDVRIDGSPPGTTDSERPRICCDLPYVYVAWEDLAPGTDEEDIHFDYSMDGGVTWQANDIRVDTDLPGAADSEQIDICCNGAEVALVWRDDRGGTDDIYFSRSVDAGLTWLPQDVRLSSNAPGTSNCESPLICCDGTSIYVAYLDDRDGSRDPWFTYSTDGGATWDPGFRVDTNTNLYEARDLTLCCDGEYVYVGWAESRNGADARLRDTFVNGSTP